jgi:hypothetical protein
MSEYRPPVTVTAGHQAACDGLGGYLLPKKELVSVLQILLMARRLKVPSFLPEASTLVRELSTFRARIPPAADDTLPDWREGPHDDLVLAVAVAAWTAERWIEPYTGPPHVLVKLILRPVAITPGRPDVAAGEFGLIGLVLVHPPITHGTGLVEQQPPNG